LVEIQYQKRIGSLGSMHYGPNGWLGQQFELQVATDTEKGQSPIPAFSGTAMFEKYKCLL
jgi:hypothetical protein